MSRKNLEEFIDVQLTLFSMMPRDFSMLSLEAIGILLELYRMGEGPIYSEEIILE
jgi:hypothetical protein